MDNNETILITGGGGFLGSAIIKLLMKNKVGIISFARNHYPELDKPGIKQIQGSIIDQNAISAACKNVNTVFHVAAKPGIWGKYKDYYQTNVIGTKNVIQACRQNNVSSLIYTSSPSVIFTGFDMEGVDESAPYPEKYHAHYPETKAMAERLVAKASKQGLPAIILRPHLIWGPGDNHLAPRIIARAKKLIRVGNGTNLVDTIYIENAAQAHLLAARALKNRPKLSGNIYFISQDEPIFLWKMIDNILAAGGKAPIKKSISKRTAYIIGAMIEVIYKIADKLFRLKQEPPLTRFVAQEFATAHWFNISAAKKDLGYKPNISIDEGLVYLQKWLNKKTEA